MAGIGVKPRVCDRSILEQSCVESGDCNRGGWRQAEGRGERGNWELVAGKEIIRTGGRLLRFGTTSTLGRTLNGQGG